MSASRFAAFATATAGIGGLGYSYRSGFSPPSHCEPKHTTTRFSRSHIAGSGYGGAREEVVVVVGGGIMGCSIAANIASRGKKVVVIDEQHPVRSSWGDSRGLQHGYRGVYARLLKRAREHWDQLQDKYDNRLFVSIKNLALATEEEAQATLQDQHVIGRCSKVAILSTEEIQYQFPMVQSQPAQPDQYPVVQVESQLEQQEAEGTRTVGVIDNDCLGFSAVDCVNAFEEEARHNGAEFHQQESVVSINLNNRSVLTNEGNSFFFSKLVLCCGPWTNKLLSTAQLSQLPLFVSAEQLLYLLPPAAAAASMPETTRGTVSSPEVLDQDTAVSFSHPTMPIVNAMVNFQDANNEQKQSFVYAVPALPNGHHAVKVATHMQGELMHTVDFFAKPGESPDGFSQDIYHRQHLRYAQPRVDDVDIYQKDIVKHFIDRYLPDLDVDRRLMVCRCLYTSTVDQDFVMGFHPQDQNVAVVTGFHGEGFKFAPAIGECVAELICASDMEQHDSDVEQSLHHGVSRLTQDAARKFSVGRFL